VVRSKERETPCYVPQHEQRKGCMSKQPHIVGIGIDTLKVNVKQVDAQGKFLKEPVLSDLLAIKLPEWQEQAKLPILAKVVLLSEYLWSMGSVEQAVDEVHGQLMNMFGLDLFLQVAQLDMCVDLINWEPPKTWRNAIVTHALKKGSIEEVRKDQEYYWGSKLQTSNVSSHGAPISLKIYNKSKEIEQRSKTKIWFHDRWKKTLDARGNPLYDGKQDVWRIEFSIEREGFNQMSLDSIEDALRNLKRLWHYCTCDWLRLAQPGATKNRTRWETQAIWTLVQHAFDDYGDSALDALGNLTRQRKRQVNIEQGIAAIAGYITTVGAWSEESFEKETYIPDLFAMIYYMVQERWEKQGIIPEEAIRVKRFLYDQKS
jgi:hypothetical protein